MFEISLRFKEMDFTVLHQALLKHASELLDYIEINQPRYETKFFIQFLTELDRVNRSIGNVNWLLTCLALSCKYVRCRISGSDEHQELYKEYILLKDFIERDITLKENPDISRLIDALSDIINYLPLEESIVSHEVKIDESWSFSRLFKEGAPEGWRELFNMPRVLACAEKNERVIKEKTEGLYVPLKVDLLKAFELTPLSEVKVVILGQDPYYTVENGIPQAMGLSFSTRRNTKIQPSLINIYKELENTVDGWKFPGHGDLTEWATRGVLLLNVCLTTRPGIAKAHGNIWISIIEETINLIKSRRPNTIFILWGNDAQKLIRKLGKLEYLIGSHPSPLSANKGGFFGGDYFNKVNQHLISKGMEAINWNLTP